MAHVFFFGSDARADVPPSGGVAVVELFTSEGCSSCPPADAALSDLIAKNAGKRVYALSFHVDYWNHLGWRDRFSDKAFSARQRAYGTALRLESIYTPQAVVNGVTQLVGSNKLALETAVVAALKTEAAAELKITANRRNGRIVVDVSAGLPEGTLIHVAWVEDGHTTIVRNGENGGQTLRHDHVVRRFASAPLSKSGTASVELTQKPDPDATRASLIVFAQRPADLRVLAASEVNIPK